MVCKRLWKLSVPILALVVATACSNGIQDDMNPLEEPTGIELNQEDPVNGDMNTEESAD